MHRLKNMASSGQRIAPDPANACDGDLDADLEQLIKTLKNHPHFSSKQLTVLRQVQAQLRSPMKHDVQTKGPASLLPPVGQEYFKPKEAAAYLNSSASTLAKRRLHGNGPRYHRIGTAIRYRKSDLDQFMALSAVTSTSEAAAR
jgi:excisionase family DNA binding protein